MSPSLEFPSLKMIPVYRIRYFGVVFFHVFIKPV
jgi:hypothetical protein